MLGYLVDQGGYPDVSRLSFLQFSEGSFDSRGGWYSQRHGGSVLTILIVAIFT